MKENRLVCCVSGSYEKCWPEIQNTIKEFRDNNIVVLEPAGNWVLHPGKKGFRPLSNELSLLPSQVEAVFLKAILRSNFLYLDNHLGYFGNMASLEVGFALANKKPVFIRQPPSQFIDIHPEFLKYIQIAPPGLVRKILDPGE